MPILPFPTEEIAPTQRLGLLRRFLRIVGPGVITGAADDDPSGIATCTQTGAQFGYGQLWTVMVGLPLMIAIQEACARIGAVTGKGIAGAIKERYPKPVLFAVVALIVAANTINIGTDIGAMAASAHLILPFGFKSLALIMTATTLALEIFSSYRTYAKVLKVLVISLAAYAITVFIVRQPWLTILKATFIPHVELSFSFFYIITGVFGTTISPYMFFWEASEEVEEERSKGIGSGKDGRPAITSAFMRNLRIDNFIGMVFSQLGTWCIIVVAATVLHQNGVTNIVTAADAASALEPLVHTFPHAGFLARTIFAIGVVGLGLLAVPVLAGSASYAVSEAAGWKEGLDLKFRRAAGFYGIITVATLIGLAMNFLGIDPIKALIFTAVFNGVAAVPLIFVIAKVASNEEIMGSNKLEGTSVVLVWITFAIMAVAALLMLATLGRS